MAMFNLFPKKPKQLYQELSPSDRVSKLMEEYVLPVLSQHGFNYNKKQKLFIKKSDFFNFSLHWHGNKYNSGNSHVSFGMSLGISSTKYAKWVKDYYKLTETPNTSIDHINVEYIADWQKIHLTSGYYDLVQSDNMKLMEEIATNVKNAGRSFFKSFSTVDQSIVTLKQYPIKNLELIVDLHIIQNQWKEAYAFFEANKHWHEEQELEEGHHSESQYVMNRKIPFELRKSVLEAWRQSD